MALCTSTGHFLSVHKANLGNPKRVFTYLGFEFDVPRQVLRVPDSRREKIRAQIQEICSHPICDFHELEKLRGRLCSLLIICPLTRLYIREMTNVLVLKRFQICLKYKFNIL